MIKQKFASILLFLSKILLKNGGKISDIARITGFH